MSSTSSSNTSVVFNGNTFVQNLQNLLAVNETPVTAADLSSLNYIQNYPNYTFFNQFATNTNPLTTWSSFAAAWSDYTGDRSQGLLNAFVADYEKQMGYTSGASGDWSILGTGIQGSTNGVTDATMVTSFENSFSSFLQNYPYITSSAGVGTIGSTSTSSDAITNFFTNWTQFMASTAVIQNGTTVANAGQNISLDNYKQVFNAFFPNATPAQYASTLETFYQQQLTTNGGGNPNSGWFIPSQSFNQWYSQMESDYISNSVKSSIIPNGSTTGTTDELAVINNVMATLISMINTLQLISASQANYLNFLTNWQGAYTTMQGDVPQFREGLQNADGSPAPLSGSDAASQAYRNNDVNPYFTSVLTELQAQQGQVQDTAKSEQTAVNQSQDASNQATQLITSLLQELNTILSQIFR